VGLHRMKEEGKVRGGPAADRRRSRKVAARYGSTGKFKRKKREVPETGGKYLQSGGGYDDTGRQWRRAGIPSRTCARTRYSRTSRARPQSCSSTRRATKVCEQQSSASLFFSCLPPKPGCRRVRGHAGGVAVLTHLTGVVLFICGVAGVSSHNKIGTLLGRVQSPAKHRSWAHDSAPPATSRVWGGM
jgi:hypothetical protein